MDPRAHHALGVEAGLDVSKLEQGDFLPPPLKPGEVAAARHALRCGALAELRAATRDPMTVDRFWSNLTGAIGRTRLEVPGDPFEAERKFCGPHQRTGVSKPAYSGLLTPVCYWSGNSAVVGRRSTLRSAGIGWESSGNRRCAVSR